MNEDLATIIALLTTIIPALIIGILWAISRIKEELKQEKK